MAICTNAATPKKEEPKTRRGLIWLLRSAFAFSLAVCAVPAYAAKDISAKGIKRENIKLTYTSGNVEIKKGGKLIPITRSQQGIYPSGYGPPQSYYV